MTNIAPYVLAHAYASLETTPPVLAGSTNVHYLIPPRDDAVFRHPRREYRYGLQRLASHCGHKSLVAGRTVGPVGEWHHEGPLCDAVPFYMHHAVAAAAAGDDDYKITENASGVPVELVTHVEFNQLGKVWDLHPSYTTRLAVSVRNRRLWAAASGVGEQVTAGNKLTTQPAGLFGDETPLNAYPATGPFNAVTWDAKTISAWFAGISITSTCNFDQHEYEHQDELGLLPRNERDFDEPTMSIVVMDEATLREVFDAVGTSSDLELTFGRTATDYLKIKLNNVHLKYFDVEPTLWKSTSGEAGTAFLADLVFTPPTLGSTDPQTRIEVIERQAVANAPATYQLT